MSLADIDNLPDPIDVTAFELHSWDINNPTIEQMLNVFSALLLTITWEEVIGRPDPNTLVLTFSDLESSDSVELFNQLKIASISELVVRMPLDTCFAHNTFKDLQLVKIERGFDAMSEDAISVRQLTYTFDRVDETVSNEVTQEE